MNPNKRAAAQEKHRNLMCAYTSNRLFPPSILTLRIHLIDHDHPSCHPLSSPTHHPCHPPSSSITILITSNIHLTPCLSQGEFARHLVRGEEAGASRRRSKRNVRPVFTSPIIPAIHRHHPSPILITSNIHLTPRLSQGEFARHFVRREEAGRLRRRAKANVRHCHHPPIIPAIHRHHPSPILITSNIHPTPRLSQGEFARHLLRREEARRLRRRATSNVRRRMYM